MLGSLHTLCRFIPWVHVRQSAGVTLCPVGGVIPWVHVRESAHAVPSGRGYTIGAHEGECLHTLCQWEGLYRGCTRGRGLGFLHTLCRVIPWVHVRESAGVLAHTVPSGRSYTVGARERE